MLICSAGFVNLSSPIQDCRCGVRPFGQERIKFFVPYLKKLPTKLGLNKSRL